jgi:hypothetical protein
MTDQSPIIYVPTEPMPTLTISAAGRQILSLDVKDGRLVAVYDAADLDEAARIFIEEVTRRTIPMQPVLCVNGKPV